MTEEKLLTVREASQLLDISEREVIDLAQGGQLPAYKVGGQYLRFKRSQVELFRLKLMKFTPRRGENTSGYSFKDKLGDFFYFNDFYILSLLIILWMLFLIVKT